MRLTFIILLALFLWSLSVSIQFKPRSKLPPSSSTCRESTIHGQSLIQALNKGTIVSINDNGKVLHIGIPGNWAAFSSKEQKNTIHQVHCYAKELHRELRYTRNATLPQ